jgi:FKBP-type peptidyl-prolyl cis-trans isomerase FklB
MSRHVSCGALAASLLLGFVPAPSPLLALSPAAAAVAGNPDTAAAAQAPPAVAAETASYDIGLLLGNQLANNGLVPTISRESLARGIDAALGGKIASAAQKESAQQFIQAARNALAARNAEVAHQFLAKNVHERGIKTLPSGLQYRVLAAGDPAAPLPGPRDQVTLRYRASLADGTEIDRSDAHTGTPTFRLNSVIPGWHEALSAMRPGAKWQVFVPPELGYGANAPAPIPPGALLIYELELLRVEPATSAPAPPRPAAAQ